MHQGTTSESMVWTLLPQMMAGNMAVYERKEGQKRILIPGTPTGDQGAHTLRR